MLAGEVEELHIFLFACSREGRGLAWSLVPQLEGGGGRMFAGSQGGECDIMLAGSQGVGDCFAIWVALLHNSPREVYGSILVPELQNRGGAAKQHRRISHTRWFHVPELVEKLWILRN